jgi:hypothetical protein
LSSLSSFSLFFLSRFYLSGRPLFYCSPRKMCPPVLKTIYLVPSFFSLFVSLLQNNLSPVLSKNIPPSSPLFLCNLLPCPSIFYFFSLKNNLLSKSPSVFHFFFSQVSKTISLVPNRPPSFRSPLCNLFVFFKIFFPLSYRPPPLVFIRGRGRGPPYPVMTQGKVVGAALSSRPRDVCRA